GGPRRVPEPKLLTSLTFPLNMRWCGWEGSLVPRAAKAIHAARVWRAHRDFCRTVAADRGVLRHARRGLFQLRRAASAACGPTERGRGRSGEGGADPAALGAGQWRGGRAVDAQRRRNG